MINEKINPMKIAIILAIILTVSTFSLIAQPPPPPDNAGTGGGPIGSGPLGAPIDGGLTILLALAGAYAGRKIRIMKSEK
jgi:hypothetical protein